MVAPRIITYSLRAGARTSDEYYRDIARFTDRWVEAATRQMRDGIVRFREFRRENDLADRSEAECAFELLTLGVLLREHCAEAKGLPGWLARIQMALTLRLSLRGLQDRRPQAENFVKVARGCLGRLARRREAGRVRNSDVGRLLTWLRAAGDAARADRLAQWQAFFEEIGTRPTHDIIARCLALADDFAADSLLRLGKYTNGVERFVAEVAPKYRWRYDAELVSRSRLEYHLGLLGTEVLSRAYRERFLAARRKIVIAPPCMRAQPEEKCKAITTPLGAQCQHCTPSCRVHQITRLGEKRGFEVYIIPDELRGFGVEAGRSLNDIGLVGIACALTNWGGGWEADALGVPAQGVLLDYVGCKYHWDEKGIPTDVNLHKLQEVVGKS